MRDENESKGGFLLAGCMVALASFLPFARIFLGGQSLFFRDLSGQFFPARRFILDGLAKGEWRFWNPLVHEGVPVALPPYAYLPDLLQLLVPNEFGISLLLALHIPLAAVSFLLLARHLQLSPVAAAAGALIYALGGFSLSTINLYVYVETLAWAPLFILAFGRAVASGRLRAIALSAMALAMMISTTGLEIAIQACVLAVALFPPSSRSRFLRSAASASLGLALTAAVVLPLLGPAGQSERGLGFPTSVVLANSIHPMTFLQVLIAGFYGDISNLSGTWWGVNFFPRGFPYLLSLYLGPTVLALAFVGASLKRPLRGRLIALAIGGALVGLGRYAGWEHFLDLSASLRFLRFPAKAFFTVQFSIALLASFAVAEIGAGNKSLLRRLTFCALGLGGALVGTLLTPGLAPQATTWFLNGFLPPGLSVEKQTLVMRLITGDAAISGLVCLVAGAVVFAAYGGHVLPMRAALALAALVGADLIRGGAGLNASVTKAFYSLSSEMTHEADVMRQTGGRLFTCDPEASKAYWDGRHARGAYHEAFTMATMQEALIPDFNVPFGVKTALSIDRTSLVPTSRVLSPELATCREFARIVPALRAAGVNRVISLDPLNDPNLRLLREVSPLRIAPITLRLYELGGAAPRFDRPATIVREGPDYLSLDITVDEATTLTIRDPFAAGWRATVNGSSRAIARTAEGHRAVPLDKGKNQVRMSYEPPGLRAGIGISLTAFMACLGLFFGAPRLADDAGRVGRG